MRYDFRLHDMNRGLAFTLDFNFKPVFEGVKKYEAGTPHTAVWWHADLNRQLDHYLHALSDFYNALRNGHEALRGEIEQRINVIPFRKETEYFPMPGTRDTHLLPYLQKSVEDVNREFEALQVDSHYGLFELIRHSSPEKPWSPENGSLRIGTVSDISEPLSALIAMTGTSALRPEAILPFLKLVYAAENSAIESA